MNSTTTATATTETFPSPVPLARGSAQTVLDPSVYPSICKAFPPGTTIVDATPGGHSTFGSSFRITAKIPKTIGSPSIGSWRAILSFILSYFAGDDHVSTTTFREEPYFLKVCTLPLARMMVNGEYEGSLAMYDIVPEFVPRPHSWGMLFSDKSEAMAASDQVKSYFYLSQFIELLHPSTSLHPPAPPPPPDICAPLAALHMKSVSPNGLFGFHAPVVQGSAPWYFGPWEASWTVYFTKMFTHMVDLDNTANGVWDALSRLTTKTIEEIIPCLIGAMESDGRSIKPSLIHGDLWEGNVGVEKETGRVVIFDGAVLWAHAELDVGDWRCTYNKIGAEDYRMTYCEFAGKDEPVEQWDDRNRLYCAYYNLSFSASHLEKGIPGRQMAFNDLYYLIDKYFPFKDGKGPPKLKESERVALSEDRDHTGKV